jgi:hypothetical protein
MKSRILNKVFHVVKKKNSIRKKIKNINYYEKKYDLFKSLNSNYLKWDYIRLILTRSINKVENNLKIDLTKNLIDNILKNLFYFKNFKIFTNNEKKNIIFFGHNRGILKDNFIKDEYIEKIVKLLKNKKVQVFSDSHFYHGSKYNYSDNRIFLNYLNLYLKIKSLIKLCFFKNNLQIIKDKKKKFELIYLSEKEEWWLNYFKKVKPKYIFFVSINSQISIIRAANRLGLVSLEIQHGTPNSKKIEYIYSLQSNKRLSSPTYFLSWGSYWKKYVNKFYYRKSILSIGKNIDDKIRLYNQKNSNMLFIDQVIFRNELINKAVSISKNFNSKIIYRFHPNKNFKKDYEKKLKENNILVHHPKSNNLSDSLKNVKFVVGVASTALLELAAKNYKVLILPSEEFVFNDLLSKNLLFNLRMIDNKLVEKKQVFNKVNLKSIKKIIR